ncbi:hypothetical protein BC830DRAFT_891384 [Chytriomyces sp. MP71]|nr:hypothetical protein BC830DRAFT_891384 [Chytriomyces sp. MP71]
MAGLDAARIVSVRLADAPASGQGLSSDEDAGWQPNDADPTEVNPREVNQMEVNQMELNQMELNPTEVNPTEITRKVISDTARMLAAKKKFDPPTVLFVGLKACLDRESRMANKAVPVNPNSRIPGKKYMSATSFHPSNTVEHLAHIAVDHKTHLSNVLRAQTQQLLASSTPAEYLRTLHAQLEGMTRALHECIDALAEERRMRESWRGKWEKAAWKLQKEIERRRSELQGRASGRVRECYLVNGLEPVAWSRGQVETLEAFLALEKDGGGTPQRQNSGETMMQRRRLLHTAPESSSRMQPGEFGSDLADVYGDRYDARSKSASVTATNRPKYLPDSGPTDKIPRLHLKHPNKNAEPQSRPEKIPRIPTARTEIENDSILDKRLVEVKANYRLYLVENPRR